MDNILVNLSKEDLIKVIATMYDTVEDWDSGRGFTVEDSSTLKIIGSTCVNHVVNTEGHNWKLPTV